jgi:hypothetical protein
MRFLLILVVLGMSTNLFAQTDFVEMDKQTYDCYLKGDYKNLKKTGNKMLSMGIDYYYLRMRMGILAFNNQRYSEAFKHFNKGIKVNSFDTISREYNYFSYLYSGRKSDANLYLESIPWEKRNKTLQSIEKRSLSEVYISSSISGYDYTLYSLRNYYYEAVESSYGVNAGFENYFSNNLKGNFAYSYFSKSGTIYSTTYTSGTNLDFSQHQFYGKLTGLVLNGWEFSGFGHVALYSDGSTQSQMGNRRSLLKVKSEFLGGVGITKNGWKVRTGLNASYSNFGGSTQIRGEGYLTYLPFGNLNLYFTSGGMYQSDKNWGATYQANQEVGLKVFKFLWLEAGVVVGNSFLNARNQGLVVNNSYQIPTSTVYANLIFLTGEKFNITVSPYFNMNNVYSWDLSSYKRYDVLNLNSYGCSIKLNFKNK